MALLGFWVHYCQEIQDLIIARLTVECWVQLSNCDYLRCLLAKEVWHVARQFCTTMMHSISHCVTVISFHSLL